MARLIHFDLLGVMLKDVLHHDLHLLILGVPVLVFGLVPRDLVSFLAEPVLVRCEDLHEMEVVGGARVPIDDDEAVAEPVGEYMLEELFVGLLVEVLPAPLVLMEQLVSIGLEALLAEPKPELPEVVKRGVHHVARDGLRTGEQQHVLIGRQGVSLVLPVYHLLVHLLGLPLLLVLSEGPLLLDDLLSGQRVRGILLGRRVLVVTERIVEVVLLDLLLFADLALG